MAKFAEIFLGILTAMGGFVEIGELTFTLNGGVHFGYQLLWVVVMGTIGIMVFSEMAGRIAAVRRRPVFSLIRERVGFNAALTTLVAALLVNLLTCAAEIGGLALVFRLAFGAPNAAWVLFAFAMLVLVVWFVSFQWIERIYGLGGLLLIAFLVALWEIGPDWHAAAAGLIPRLPAESAPWHVTLYLFYAVALTSSIMLPYETYFYASGGIEDEWTAKDVPLNRFVVLVGFALGGLLAAGLLGVGAQFFARLGMQPQLPGSAALAPATVLGSWGFFAALIGMFFAFGGAAIETSLSSAYNLAQFFGWPWGKHKPKRETGRFTLSWVATFALAALVAITGVSPVAIVEYSIVFSVVILPFTFLPVLVVARDAHIMGAHANGRFANVVGTSYLVVITVAALAAIPLLIATHGGKG
jgi:manganese transport protein